MAEITWSAHATEDLADIADYIAADNPDAASRLVSRICTSIDQLADFPFSGRVVPEFPRDRFREIVVYPCRVIYIPKPEAILIVRIIRGEQLLQSHMLSTN